MQKPFACFATGARIVSITTYAGIQLPYGGSARRNIDELNCATWKSGPSAGAKLAKEYNKALAQCDVDCPAEMPWARHVYHLYTLRSKDRNGLQKALLAEGIQTAVHYAEPVHVQPAYSDLGYVRGAFPQAERAASPRSYPCQCIRR